MRMHSKARFVAMSRGRGLQDEDDDYLNYDDSNGNDSHGTALEFEEETEEAGGRGRGPNRGTAADNDGGVPLEVADDSFVSASASRAISATLKAHLGGPYPTFKLVPLQTKNFLWEKFKTQYSWPPNDENQVKKAWHTTCTNRLKGIFKTARDEAKAKSNSENVVDWKGFGPDWLSPEYWNEIIDKEWNKDEWKKKPESGRKNRLTLKCGTITKHTGGSITFAAHKRRLEKILGKSPSASQFFKQVHRRKQGEGDFVDNKSKIVCEKYESSIVEKHGPNESTQLEIDFAAWCEASQGPSKSGCLYGLGIKYPTANKLGTSSTSPGNDDEISTLKENVDELRRDKEELLRQMEERAQEEERKCKEFEENIHRMLNERN